MTKMCVSVCQRHWEKAVVFNVWKTKCREVRRRGRGVVGVISQHWRSFLFNQRVLGETQIFKMKLRTPRSEQHVINVPNCSLLIINSHIGS